MKTNANETCIAIILSGFGAWLIKTKRGRECRPSGPWPCTKRSWGLNPCTRGAQSPSHALPLEPTLACVFVRVWRALGGWLCVCGGACRVLCACTRALRRSTCASCVVVWVLVCGETHAKTIVSGSHMKVVMLAAQAGRPVRNDAAGRAFALGHATTPNGANRTFNQPLAEK